MSETFAGYGAVNAGREYNDVEISQRTFREQYLKPFRMAMHADPAMVMTAFNAVDRRPVSGNKELLEDILRKENGVQRHGDLRLGGLWASWRNRM